MHPRRRRGEEQDRLHKPRRGRLREARGSPLNSERGKGLKKRRSTDVETAFGDIRRDFGFTRLTLRGLEKCALELRLVAAGHNRENRIEEKYERSGPAV